MRKFLVTLTFVVLAVISVSAQTIRFKTTSYTSKEYTAYGWTNWRPYQSSDMLVTMNLDTDIVTIYSPRKQIYKIISYEGEYIDNDGEPVLLYRFIDQDGDMGTMKLMQRRSGKSELYIQFSNIIWVYSVIRL